MPKLTYENYIFRDIVSNERGQRAVDTVTISAEESVRIGGEYFPLDISKRNQGTYNRLIYSIAVERAVINHDIVAKVTPHSLLDSPLVLSP